MEGDRMTLLDKALKVAVARHDGQYRKHTELPFVIHPITVMYLLTTWGIQDEEILAAALLHDTLEDTDLDELTIWKEFGQRVANFVQDLTKDEDEDKEEYLNGFVNKSIEVILIKVADRLINTLDFSNSGQDRYANTYFWQAKPIFDIIDIRKYEIEFEMYDKIIRSIRSIMKTVEL
jgi:(p)ppGpp synthase/HD superfamily hydrolase